MKKVDRIHFMIGLICLNIIYKGWCLTNNSIAGDEPFSIYHSQLDITTIIDYLSQGNNPPFYEIILHYWTNLFGLSKLSVRLPSLIFSSLTIIYLYKIGLVFKNRWQSIIACLIFIFMNYHTLFAHEARVYSLVGFLAAGSIYYFLQLLMLGYRHSMIMLILSNTILLYSHYTGFVLILFQAIAVLAYRNREHVKLYLLHALALVMLYSPMLWIFAQRFIDVKNNGTWLSPPSGLVDIYYIVVAFSNKPVVAIILCIVIISGLMITLYKQLQKENMLLYFLFLGMLIFSYLISYVTPIFLDRYLMVVAICFVVTLAHAISQKSYPNWIKSTVSLLSVVALIATSTPIPSNKRNVEELIGLINNLKRGSTVIYAAPESIGLNLFYYLSPDDYSNISISNFKSYYKAALEKQSIRCINHKNDIPTIDSDAEHILFVDGGADLVNPNNSIRDHLITSHSIISEHNVYEIFTIMELEKVVDTVNYRMPKH